MGNILYKRKQTITGLGSNTYTQKGLIFLLDAEDSTVTKDGSNNVTAVTNNDPAIQRSATATGNPIWSATGLNGKPAFVLDGSVKYLNYGDILDNGTFAHADNIFAGTDVKFTTMIACRFTGSSQGMIYAKYGSGSGGGFLYFSSSGKIGIENCDSTESVSSTLNQETSNSFVNTNTIITVTFDYSLSPNTAKQTIRVNGASQTIAPTVRGNLTLRNGTGLGENTSAQFRIGIFQLSDLFPFTGSIKTVAFWNRVLNSTEITYNEGIMNTKAGGIF